MYVKFGLVSSRPSPRISPHENPVGGGSSAFTVVVAVAELFPVFGSAVSWSSPSPCWRACRRVAGVTLIVTVALPPEAIEPSAQVTVVVPEQVPWLDVAETNGHGSRKRVRHGHGRCRIRASVRRVSVYVTLAADESPGRANPSW